MPSMTSTPPVRASSRRARRAVGALLLVCLALSVLAWRSRNDGAAAPLAADGPAASAARSTVGTGPPGTRRTAEELAIPVPTVEPDATTPVATEPAPPATPPADTSLTLAVDPALAPRVASLPGVRPGDPDRPVGRLTNGPGTEVDLVLDELVVLAPTPSAVQPLLDRGATIVSDTPVGAAHQLLLRLPAGRVADAGPKPELDLAGRLRAIDPDLDGTLAVSHPALLDLLADTAGGTEAGLVIMPNWLTEPDSIADGHTQEDPNRPNGFTWSFLQEGGQMDYGVAPAWQLLGTKGKLDHRVGYLVADAGFVDNADFPAVRQIHGNEFGRCGKKDCTLHGTQVTIAGMGQVDNQVGTAGPAGPVAELVALERSFDLSGGLAQILGLVLDTHPRVVNMSWHANVKVFRSAVRDIVDAFFAAVRGAGALPFATPGNSGSNVDIEACLGNSCWDKVVTVPCESSQVICVGGTGSQTENGGYYANNTVHPSSNFGTDKGSRTVEIYAPFCLLGSLGPGNRSTVEAAQVCGTSFSSPFTAGIAALVFAADPSLAPGEVEDILFDTAKQDSGNFSGHRRRVDALAAVMRALHVEQAPPALTIEAPVGGEYNIEDTFIFHATASSFVGNPLDITWSSSIEGDLGTSGSGADHHIGWLRAGRHVITATVTDEFGQTVDATLSIDVIDTPPEVTIGSPTAGDEIWEDREIHLIGATLDRDTWTVLPDEQVRWEIARRSGGGPLRSANGHDVVVPGLDPGLYTVRFIASGIVATVDIEVLKVEPGQVPPVATILSPAPGILWLPNGVPQTVTLSGAGQDVEDGALDGTRFRWRTWLADDTRPDGGKEHAVVRCVGSAVPGAGGGGGGFAVHTDCATKDIVLGFAPGDQGSVWMIELTVVDSTGHEDTAVVRLDAELAVG